MATPVILIDSATGSDTAASGAGPTTALTGSAGVSVASVVTLDGSPDLSGVATDGSHVIYFADATAGRRNFSAISAVDNVAKTVTVVTAFTAATKAWAIGGKRVSIGSATSKKLFDNNGAAGDALPGWTVELQSGHSETIAATYDWRRSGSSVGPITLRGASGAATRPLLIYNQNSAFLSLRGDLGGDTYFVIKDLELQNTNATKTASIAITFNSANGPTVVSNVKVNNSTNKFWKAAALNANAGMYFKDCDFGYCAASAIDSNDIGAFEVFNCWIHDCTSHGITTSTGPNGNPIIIGCLITNNGGDGIHLSDTSTSSITGIIIIGNTIDGNTGDGIEVTTVSVRTLSGTYIANNIISNNGGYGVNFSNGSATDAIFSAYGALPMQNNCFYNNTSGKYNGITIANSLNEQTSDPQFTNSAAFDYSIGGNLRAKGHPLGGTTTVGITGSTYSYTDIGVAQRQEPPVGKVVGARSIGTY